MKYPFFRILPFLFFLIFNFGCDSSYPDKASAPDLEEITIAELHKNYKEGGYTAKEAVQEYLNRIKKYDENGPAINSVLTLNPRALSIADSLDKLLAEGAPLRPLHGVPVLLKDNIATGDGMPNTAGSAVMKDSKPEKDSFIVKKLRENGAIILGKVNLSEWANYHSDVSSSGWSALGGQTKNPYDVTRNPCGSSSGSGAAVAANFAMLSVGTETNGSIVCPSSANGIAGIKPTVGLLSRTGIIPIAETQDTPGPMARTLTDAVIMLNAMTGTDPEDERTKLSTEYEGLDYTEFLTEGAIEGKRLGLYKPSMGSNFRTDSVMNAAIEKLKELGAEIIEIDRIGDRSAGANSGLVLQYEFKDGINKYLEWLGENAPVKDFAEVVEKTLDSPLEMKYDHNIMKRALERGGLDSEEYRNALAAMLEATRKNGIDKVMDEHKLDAFIGISGGPAWKTDPINGDNYTTSSSSPAAMAGYPNISVPMGFIDGLPVGISFFGKAWSEPQLISIAFSFEQATKARRAPLLE